MGGVAADDAQYMQKARQEQARYLEVIRNTPPVSSSTLNPAKLIEVSPEKKVISKNANLLIDLDLGPDPASIYNQGSHAKTASSKSKGKAAAKVNMSLLD